ncbi:MAG: FAD-dependent oxidoreductase [Desulfobacterales bacterium]|nr:FAD-dependent oxidoreductase [Desulfobacterales bacterium]
MERQTDLVVVGAGPAGLAAACSASRCGLEVALVDENPSPGGQLFRNIESPLGQSMLNARERQTGMELVESFRKSGVTYYPGTTVWGIEPRLISCTRDGKPMVLPTASIIIAPGGMERPVPFPGWTLPGVMSAGGAEILLRSGGSLQDDPAAPVVLAGNGPLLLLLASHLIKKGVPIAAWLDTGQWFKRWLSTGLMPASLLDTPYLGKGVSMALQVIKNKIPMVTGVRHIRAEGDRCIDRVTYVANGKTQTIETGCLIRHEGVIPRTHILNAMGAGHRWDPVQRYWYPITDTFGATRIDGVYLTGDAGYVHGGDAGMIKGTLSGIAAARQLGIITENEAGFRVKKPLAGLRRMRIARGFLRYLFAPNPQIYDMTDETIVCRCESVTAGEIRQVVREGNTDVNEVKRFTRCGMGPCQGRMCGPALAEITAQTLSKRPDAVGALRVRQPFRPVTLENYCHLYAKEKG